PHGLMRSSTWRSRPRSFPAPTTSLDCGAGSRPSAGGASSTAFPASGASESGAGPLEPLAHRDVVPRVLASPQLGADLAEQPVPLGDDVVLVDRLQVLLPGEHERFVVEVRIGRDQATHHLAHAVLDEARPAVRLLND